MHTIDPPEYKYFLQKKYFVQKEYFVQKGIFVNNTKGHRLAAMKFYEGQFPFYIWIRKDLEKSYQQAIASLFALMIAVMGL